MPTEGEITGAMQQLAISRAEAETVEYIGDGVYATHDGYQVWVRTLEGQAIALEPPVMRHLIDYAKQLGAVSG